MAIQVNVAERGFSFMKDGPADMGMDPTVSTVLFSPFIEEPLSWLFSEIERSFF